MRHVAIDDWRLEIGEGYVDMKPHIFNYIKINRLKPVSIDFDDVCFKKDIDYDARYLKADVSYPKIVTQAINPENKKFRLIDGKNRIHKEIEQGKKSGLFYVIPIDVVNKYFVRKY